MSDIMSVKLRAGSRTIYLDLKQMDDGSRYLSIREVGRESRVTVPPRILIDEHFIPDLHRALGAVLDFLNPAVTIAPRARPPRGPTPPRPFVIGLGSPRVSRRSPIETPPPKRAHGAYSVEEKRQTHVQAYMPWDAEQEARLCDEYRAGHSILELSRMFGRTEGAIRSRLLRLGLIER